MNYDKYENVTYSDDFLEYEFVSIGNRGDLRKFIQYSPYKIEGVFNLALGTILKNGDIDYKSITNNGDVNKILATTATTSYKFFEKYPDYAIFLTGDVRGKTRLYQMAINTAYDELVKDFRLWGLIFAKETKSYTQHEIEKGVNYDAFLIAKRK